MGRRKPGAREVALVRYRARVEYDGTDFAGFQAQPGARTVQGELEAALGRLTGETRITVDGAGRTDSGVHATGQVIAFTVPSGMPAAEIERALNGLLPPDVAIRGLRRAPLGFHPRHAARYREYRYTVWNGQRSPLRARTAYWVRDPLDADAMAAAAATLVGRHDFGAFGSAPIVGGHTVRTVNWIKVRRTGALITIDIAADAFLRGMARRLVAVLLGVGHGTLNPTAVAALLAERRPALNGAAAPARGLCLTRVVLGRPQSTERRTGSRA